MNRYFYDTGLSSPITDIIFKKLSGYNWWLGTKNDQYQVRSFDQNLINLDPLLKKYHGLLRGRLNLFKFPPMTSYQWHRDGSNLFNFNLVFEESRSFTVFKEDPQDLSKTHKNSQSLIELKYQPLRWYVFNAQVEHTVFHLGDRDRLLLTYTVPIESTIDYRAVINELAGPERFELPTAGFEDQNSSTELRTDIFGRG